MTRTESYQTGKWTKASKQQEALWLLHEMYPDRTDYLIFQGFTIEKLDPVLFIQALQILISRHEILATSFQVENSTLMQCIDVMRQPPILLSLDSPRTMAEMQAQLEASFNLPVSAWQVALFKTGPTGIGLIFCFHHLIMDAYSIDLLCRELGLIYTTLTLGQPLHLPPSTSYADYCFWQDELIRDEIWSEHAQFWRQKLAEFGSSCLPQPDDLQPTEQPRPCEYSFVLDDTLRERLGHFSQEQGITPYAILSGVFALAILPIMNADRYPLGIVLQGRTRVPNPDFLGPAMNSLLVDIHLQLAGSVLDFLRSLADQFFDCMDHEEFYLSELTLPSGQTAASLLNVMHVHQSQRPGSGQAWGGYLLMPVKLKANATKFAMTLLTTEEPDQLSVDIEFNPKILAEATIRQLGISFCRILEHILNDPTQTISTLLLALPPSLIQGEAIAVEDTDAATLFRKRVDQHPNRLVCVDGIRNYTYADLEQASRALSQRIQQLVASRGALIAVQTPRSWEFLVAIVAVLRSGNTFLPLDETLPVEYCQNLVELGPIDLILTMNQRPLWGKNCPHLSLTASLDRPSIAAEEPILQGSDPLYCIFTSGSTGRPKGVRVSHHNLLNYHLYYHRNYRKKEIETVACFTSISFDLTITTYLCPILSGDTVLMYRDRNPFAIQDLVQRDEVGILKATPSQLKLLDRESLAQTSNLHTLIVGGEDFAKSLADFIKQATGSRITVINEYGPTETTVGCTAYWYESLMGERTGLPIGTPLANTSITIEDSSGRVCPRGQVGEIVVHGSCVSLGYIGATGKLAEDFAGGVYRTGDLGRLSASGQLEYLGRIDRKVKVRGYRIDCLLVENQLSACGAGAAFVTCEVDSVGDAILVAYVQNKGSLREQLADRLPHYMLPTRFHAVTHIPLNRNGKVDIGALHACVVEDSVPTLPTGMTLNPTEEMIREHVAKDLKLDPTTLAIDANYFHLGGHSIGLFRLVSALRRELKGAIDFAKIYQNPTLRNIAKVCEAPDGSVIPATAGRADAIHLLGPNQLPFLQHFLISGPSVRYNVPLAFRILSNEHSPEVIRGFLLQILKRHKVFATKFSQTAGTLTQTFTGPIPSVPIQQMQTSEVSQYVLALNQPFDLFAGPPIRAEILVLDDQSVIVVVIMHHIITDEISQDLILREFQDLMQGRVLPAIDRDYPEFLERQSRQLQSADARCAEHFWQQEFDDYQEPPGLCCQEDPRPVLYSQTMSPALCHQLEALAKGLHVPLQLVCHGIFRLILGWHSQQDDLIIGQPSSGRRQGDEWTAVGLFVKVLPLRFASWRDLSLERYFLDLFAHFKACLQHDYYPVNTLQESLAEQGRLHTPWLYPFLFTFSVATPKSAVFEDLGFFHDSPAKVPLSLSCVLSDDTLQLSMEAMASSYGIDAVERLMAAFLHTAESLQPDALHDSVHSLMDNLDQWAGLGLNLDLDFNFDLEAGLA